MTFINSFNVRFKYLKVWCDHGSQEEDEQEDVRVVLVRQRIDLHFKWCKVGLHMAISRRLTWLFQNGCFKGLFQ